jgi:hypothetical protein
MQKKTEGAQTLKMQYSAYTKTINKLGTTRRKRIMTKFQKESIIGSGNELNMYLYPMVYGSILAEGKNSTSDGGRG